MVIYLGIGTNLGNREANLRTALQLLDERVGERLACSSVYRSAPQGFVSDNAFANIVAVYETAWSPEEVLRMGEEIEREMGRKEKSIDGVYKDRVIDIDILLVKEGEEMKEWATERLVIPHPRMQEREFVMVPLGEVEEILKEQNR